jgi:hypothetical protein
MLRAGGTDRCAEVKKNQTYSFSYRSSCLPAGSPSAAAAGAACGELARDVERRSVLSKVSNYRGSVISRNQLAAHLLHKNVIVNIIPRRLHRKRSVAYGCTDCIRLHTVASHCKPLQACPAGCAYIYIYIYITASITAAGSRAGALAGCGAEPREENFAILGSKTRKNLTTYRQRSLSVMARARGPRCCPCSSQPVAACVALAGLPARLSQRALQQGVLGHKRHHRTVDPSISQCEACKRPA